MDVIHGRGNLHKEEVYAERVQVEHYEANISHCLSEDVSAHGTRERSGLVPDNMPQPSAEQYQATEHVDHFSHHVGRYAMTCHDSGHLPTVDMSSRSYSNTTKPSATP